MGGVSCITGPIYVGVAGDGCTCLERLVSYTRQKSGGSFDVLIAWLISRCEMALESLGASDDCEEAEAGLRIAMVLVC